MAPLPTTPLAVSAVFAHAALADALRRLWDALRALVDALSPAAAHWVEWQQRQTVAEAERIVAEAGR